MCGERAGLQAESLPISRKADILKTRAKLLAPSNPGARLAVFLVDIIGFWEANKRRLPL